MAIQDRSGTLETDEAVEVMAANANRNFLFVHNHGNLGPVPGILWLHLAGENAGAIPIGPRTSVSFDGAYVPKGAIHIRGKTGMAFTAYEDSSA